MRSGACRRKWPKSKAAPVQATDSTKSDTARKGAGTADALVAPMAAAAAASRAAMTIIILRDMLRDMGM